jgi:hypothetical protein
MSAIALAHPAARIGLTLDATPQAAKPISSSLLPIPSGVLLDPLLMLTVLTAKQRESSTQGQVKSLAVNKRAQEHALKEFEIAMVEAKKSREESSFFGDICNILGKIGTIATAVGAVASIVATGGASLPAILALSSVALSTLATANKELHLIGGDFGDTLTDGLSIGAAVAGLASAGTGLLNVGVGAAGAASEATKIGHVVGASMQVSSSSMTVSGSAAGMAAAAFAHDADLQSISADSAKYQNAMLQRIQRGIIGDVQSIAAGYQRSTETMLSILSDRQQTNMHLATSIRG